MMVSGLTAIPSRCCLQMSAHRPGLLGRQVSLSVGSKPKGIPHLKSQRYNTQQTHLIRCAMGASYGSKENDSNDIFPRINVKDPYRRLGVSRDASEYEIQSARNFLMRKYSGHKPSMDAIESAHDDIITRRYYDKRMPVFDFDKMVRKVTQTKVVQAVVNSFWTPSPEFIRKTVLAFLVLGVLTVLFPTDEGPTFQVAMSFFTTVYFIHERLKKKFRAFFYGVVSFVGAWLLGTFLMVYVATRIPMLRGALRSFEMTTSLITYVILWASATYLRNIYGW